MHADALEALYRDHYRAALLYALSLCGDRALAEDLVSDAFEAALLTLDDSHPSVRYWLLRVCRHLWLDELRRRKRRPTDSALGVTDMWTHMMGTVKVLPSMLDAVIPNAESVG